MKTFIINKAVILSTILVLLSAGIKVFAQVKHSGIEISNKADQYLKTLTELNRFSGSVLIAKDGKIVFNNQYGFANYEHEVLNNTDTKFRIASVTKQFTAMAVMMLHEERKLKVHDPICKYLTDCPEIWKNITIHHLLTMSSGIPEYDDFPPNNIVKSAQVTLDEHIETFKDKKLDFAPGEKFRYSGSNYVLLGKIIEIVSGKSYANFLQEKIFRPLKMKNTGLINRETLLIHEAEGYKWASDSFEVADYIRPLDGYSAGGMYSTTEDLLKWDRALYGEKLISKRSLETMFTPFKEHYGYGWFSEMKFNYKWINHSGHIEGFQSQLSRFPDEKIAIIILSNFDRTNIGSVTEDLAAIVFGEPYEVPKPYTEVAINLQLYNDYIGEYDLFPNASFTVLIENGNLIGQLRGQKEKMVPFSETEFYTKKYDLEIKFFRNAEGKVNYLTFRKVTKAQKIK